MSKIWFLALITFWLSCISAKSTENLSTAAALEKYSGSLKKQSFLVYPELREKPIQWFDSIPEGKIKWALKPTDFQLSARPGEVFVYQVGVWALKADVQYIQVEFSDLKSGSGKMIPAGTMTCYNKGGIDFRGNPFTKKVDVLSGRIQALWMGIDLGEAAIGIYTGSVTVTAGKEKHTIPIRLTLDGETVPNHGYNEGKRLSRLNWLNSTVGINEEVTKGYPAVKADKNMISILGRTLTIAENGLPASITSFFSPSNQTITRKGEPVVNAPFSFIIEKEDGKIIRLQPGALVFSGHNPSKVVWKVLNSSDECDLECTGLMEFDGFVDYRLKLTAKVPLKVRDIRLEIQVLKEKAEYMMGLNHEGGYRTPDWKWKWDITKNQDMLWVGAVNGGLRIKWKAENYVRPLINIYYEFGRLNLPPSWGNSGKGGVDVGQKNSEVVINAYSGNREMKSGQVLNYDFELMITPFHVIDRQNKFGDRYYHGGGNKTALKIENAKKAGANIINIHHAEDLYPYIDYPYLDENITELTQLVAAAHKENLRMKFYYTTRLLSKNIPEFWALNSLNGEVFYPGPGNATRTEAEYPKGPNEWYIKNMKEKYLPGWFNTISEGKFKGVVDLSFVTTPDSRLNNFYVAGLDWMVQNIGIDGVYIDDTALDRYAIQRTRKIIDQYRPEGRIDFHTWNHFCAWAGFANCLNLYMDLLPYFDLVWIGEGRDYNRAADYWLIEISGIPFGLAGQMLGHNGNLWRGMVYGITSRAGYDIPPMEIWKFWDEHKIADKIMIGYWEKECPVTSENANIRASVYKGSDEVIISVANWNKQDETAALAIDWASLGFDPSKSEIKIPGIKDFQENQSLVSLDKMNIPGKKGYLIVIKKV